MKDHDKNKESLCLQIWDVNKLYEWAMSQKVMYLEKLHELHNDLPFLQ